MVTQAWRHIITVPEVLGRARYGEDKLSNAITKGISQYVIVGAGLDTFALRRPDLRSRLRGFEPDHPLTQALKQDRLVQAALALPLNLHLCPIDFERDSVASSLSRSPFDPEIPAFFSWLGVTAYLERVSEAISNTLTSIRTVAAAGSEFVMDYADSAVFTFTQADDAVVKRLAPICVIQSGQDPKKAERLTELTALSGYERGDFLKKVGWSKMPGEAESDSRVSEECAKLLTSAK